MTSVARTPSKRGFTLIELLIVIMIVSALATLFFPLYGYLREKGRIAACVGNLRILQLGAATYMLDHENIWPQMPEDIDLTEEEPMWEWWFNTLEEYGVAKRHWICPSEKATYEQTHSITSDYYGSYLPTSYEPTPNIAFYWTSQPWFIERGQFHGKNHGPNIAMPNGTIQEGPSLFGQY